MTFQNLRLNESLLRAVTEEGYTIPTPIQLQAIPHVLAGGDLMGCAQTGTGKTAAFALPILHRLMQQPPSGGGKPQIRTLVLAPTRELAAQIHQSFKTYGRHSGLRCAVVFGGVKQNPQVHSLMAGVHILIATPGRLLDLMKQGFVDFKHLQILVLDEADNMLDMGFIPDIRRIIARVPKERQTLMFSATMPKDIRELAQTILRNPIRVDVAPVATPAETVEQSVYFVSRNDKPSMLVHYLNSNAIERVLVFTRTKHGADRVVKHLTRCGIRAQAIHGNKSQNHRVRTIESFKSSTPPVLIATDIAARGLDIDNVSHVVNFNLPNVPETYVHRIGRTGRAGATGIAISFCDGEERPFLRDIEKLTRLRIRVAESPNGLPTPPAAPAHGHLPHQPVPAKPFYPVHKLHQPQPKHQTARPHHNAAPQHAHTPYPKPHHPQHPKPGPHHNAVPQHPHATHPKPRPQHSPGPAAKPAGHPIHGAKPKHAGPASAHKHGGFGYQGGRPAQRHRKRRFV